MNNIDHKNAGVNPLARTEDFKWWRLQNKVAADLLREIVFRWRGSNAKVDGDQTPWVAYPHQTWRGWLGNISESSFERALKKLVDAGLIERQRHRFAGTSICAFFQPTAVALKHMGRPQDLARLASKKPETKPLKTNGFDGTVDGTLDGTVDGTVDGTDYTSFSSLSNNSTNSSKKAVSLETGKGKGKAGGEKKGKIIIKHVPAKSKITPEPVLPISAEDAEEAHFQQQMAKLKTAKAKNLSKLYPELKGAHEKAVKHPSTHSGWATLSEEVRQALYEKYEAYVANWYKGKKGKPYADDVTTDEEWAEVVSSIAAFQHEEHSLCN
ncbi:hypothetical protein [Agrobacterium larrymoorei]|uniref:Helix-turn-helix domain-containing protein n=1 Tax=Agrobacterium larrymoorei TaxID=160699 RepID=A0AAF0KI68_9HYPH|nr:hypothetical protein [Agrobacterium larrymoorei]WHA40154.1 hypothetical protein CFBP5477_009935 [Agrobacterium larrymoorei]